MAVTLSSATSFPKTSSLSLPSHSFSTSAPSNLVLPRHRLLCTLAFNRRRDPGAESSASPVSSSKKNKRNSRIKNDDVDDEEEKEEEEDDAFGALFSMLEEDLENDDDEDYDDITEEEMDKLQRQLETAFGVEDEVEGEDDAEDDEDEDKDKVERPTRLSELKAWQLRRLAFALKTGRRRTSIKSLAGELCLDRAVVLKYLRDPPPRLLMMSAALPDEPAPRLVIPERSPADLVPPEEEGDAVEEPAAEDETAPVHVLREKWSARKRIKKVHVDTLEKVYSRTRRPTNSMISSIVQLTNMPRNKVVKWFEDKRAEDGVPDERAPYKRLAPESISSS